jgi:hypothetical protein
MRATPAVASEPDGIVDGLRRAQQRCMNGRHFTDSGGALELGAPPI